MSKEENNGCGSPECESCSSGECSSCGESMSEAQKEAIFKERMAKIRHKIVVLSGKGGVGKSTVAVNLAVALAKSGAKVGLLDVDVHGPSVPVMLGLNACGVDVKGNTMIPVPVMPNLSVMSVGFLVKTNDALIWRGPMKAGVIRQLLGDVEWGDLDYLVVDCPPGTGDEPLSVIQLLEHAGALIVTTPQQVSAADVRRSVDFCLKLKMPFFGIVENMSGFVCPKCGETSQIFRSGAGETIAKEFNISFLGKIPLDMAIGEACDAGKPYVESLADSATAKIMQGIADTVAKNCKAMD